jgi:cystathionine gamma-synthase
MSTKPTLHFETLSVHAGRTVDVGSGDVSPAIHLATTFERGKDGSFPFGYSYIREDNPTRKALETCIAALEGGTAAVSFASGSAASFAVFSLMQPGDQVLAPRESYHGTAKQLREVLSAYGVRPTFIDMTDVAVVRAAMSESVRLVWIETPSNPLLNVTDINAISALAHNHGALVCCDNTFATPVLQRPFELGADIVMHSSTKYFGGHSDAMGGVVVVKDDALAKRLHGYQGTVGAVPAPFDCWLIHRSLATLKLRVSAQSQSALQIANYLVKHPKVEHVYYPGLPTHPGFVIARQQMQDGFGGVVSFGVRGNAQTAFAVAARLQIFTRATSLGGVESLVEHRASVEGPHSMAPPNLLRLSIGLEHADDLIRDLELALA